MATGFNFGAKTTTAPAFGTGSITFGTPVTQNTQQQQFGFGALNQPSTGGLFGSTPTTNTGGFGLGSTTATPGFGAATTGFTPAASTGTGFGLNLNTATPTGTGFGFGATPATSAATNTTGLNFNLTPASTAATNTGLTFGAGATTTTSSGLTFGAPTTGFGVAASTAPTLGLSFGTPAPAATSTTGGLSFGTTTTSTPALGLNFGTSTTTTTTAPSLFGTSTASTIPGFSFGGLTATTAASSTLNFGLGGTPSTNVLTSTTTTTTTPSVGLGGIPTTQAKTGTTTTTQKEIPPKEQPLPNEFIQIVEQFKNVVQQNKTISSEVSRSSIKEFRLVESELDLLTNNLNQIESKLQSNRNLTEKLKFDTAKGLQHIEIAQRTQDTPAGLQYENTAPLQFFLELSEHFEREMQILKTKIDSTGKFIKKYGENTALSSQDLAMGLRKLHETFVALAGRMQTVHNEVEIQKEIFLSIRKQAIRDNINPFEKLNRQSDIMNLVLNNTLKNSIPQFAAGPTPFNNITVDTNNLAMSSNNTQQTQPPPPAYPGTGPTNTGFGLSSGFASPAPNISLFKYPGFIQPCQPLSSSTSFQLQKPPAGNKRGKQ